MFIADLGTVLRLIALIVQVATIVDFNFDGNPKSDSQICCMVEHTFPKEPFVECYQKIVKEAKREIDNDLIRCIHQCYYGAIGMFSNEGLVADKYRAYRDNLEPALQKPFAWAMTFCAACVKKVLEDPAVRKSSRCNPVPYMYNRCLNEAVIANCPADRWINSSLCTELIPKLQQRYGKGILLPTEEKPSQNG
ncbi:AGAP006081-PA-like protein [Anopheles sinensis]|uniref:AGAP006081-PA-like protein n=1 Tax=Anopheles sinensis TaxID=74873 RepID=A0A084WL98_ANOSI|nr:AGAP006081-PA-like protein [Anopheles sinensis]